MLDCLVKILVPNWIKNYICRKVFRRLHQDRIFPTPGIPIHELQTQHIKNMKTLPNREALLDLMPKDSVCAEIGVNAGKFSSKILDIVKPKKLYLIDLWATDVYTTEKMHEIERKFSKEIASGVVEIIRGKSYEVLEKFENEMFDWLYIDTDHQYETTRKELEKCRTKVKQSGIIAGHDYAMGSWNHWNRYGVIEAVNEFCVINDLEMLYRTTEVRTAPSFAISLS